MWNRRDAPIDNVKPENNDDNEIVGLGERFRSAFANEPKDPEREFAPGMKSALFAMNDPEIMKLIVREDALPNRLAVETDSEKVAEEIFLYVFSRLPSKEESADVDAFIREFKGTRSEAIGDVVWAMLNSTEFLVNH